MKKKAALIIAAALSISTIFAGCGNTTQAEPVTETPAVTATTTQPAAEEKAPDKTDELARMFVKGIHNRFVLQDSKDINYLRDTEYAEKIVEDVKVDDSEVDTTKAGKYTVHYTVTVNKKNLEKAQKYLDEHPEVAAAAEKAEKPEEKTKPAEGTADTTKPAEKDADKTADAAVTPGTEAGTEEDGQNVETPAESPAEDAQAVEETTDDSTKEDENADGEAQTDEEGDKTDAETPAETPTDAQDENTASDDKPADAPAEGQTPAEQPAVIEKEPEVVIPDIPESVFEDDKDDTTPDETVEIVIDKTVEIVTPEEAVEIIDQGGEVWTDNSEPVKKEDLVSPTEETVEKPEEKKEEEKVEEKPETTNTDNDEQDNTPSQTNDDDDDYEEPSHSSGGSDESAHSEPKHEHHWVEKTRTVHHDATGHYETRSKTTKVVDEEAWDEPVYETFAVCSECGARFDNGNDAGDHIVFEHDNEASYYTDDFQVDTIHHPEVSHEETETWEEWVEDSGEWDEEVPDGYYCDECGATK